MKRNVERYLQEYHKKTNKPGTTKAAMFYNTDMEQIVDRNNGDRFGEIFDALEFGFMVGYKVRTAEMKKGK